MIVKRIGVMSLAKIMAILYAAIGLIGGVCVALFSMIAGSAFAQQGAAAGLGMGFGLGSIILFPILYGVFGFIGGLISAWLYNVIAGSVGGIELDLQ